MRNSLAGRARDLARRTTRGPIHDALVITMLALLAIVVGVLLAQVGGF
jgi:hypothetical protein